MLELARKLADNDVKYFGGWVLAGVQLEIAGSAQQLSNRTLLNKQRSSVLEVLGTDAEGKRTKEMRVFLVLPRKLQAQADDVTHAAAEGKVLARHAFSAQEIQAYVAYTGDENIIHQGDNPIVPGLCMVSWLQQHLALHALHWKVSFLAPVHAAETVTFYRKDGLITAYAGGRQVFTVQEL